jgi:hypothetical protein
MKRPTRICPPKNPYISEGSESEWPAGLPMPKVLFRRPQRLPPNEHLELVCSTERTGVIGDVIFDLRHPKLDPMDWIAESLLRIEEDRWRCPGRPFLWFPWYGKYSLELPNSGVHPPAKGQLSKAQKIAVEKDYSPEQNVCRGDTISLRQVDPEDLTGFGMRDMVQGELVRLAQLEITRPNGTVISVDTPLRFFLRRVSTQANSVDHALSKIRTMIKDAINAREIRRIAEEAELIGAMIQSRLQRQISDGESSELHHIASLSLLLGQLWAKAESATTVQPLAEVAKRSQLKAKEGGVKSGSTRRNAEWRQIAQNSAISVRQREPSFSQDDVATEISALWTEEIPRAPSHETLKKFISNLEHSGVIPRRVVRDAITPQA